MRSLRFELGTVARHAPDLAGHCQRCPDGFYRGNCDGGGSSSESTDVDNTNNGDTEKQNSDDAGNGASEDAAAAGLPSDDTEAEGDTQPSDTQPADDENNDENAPATVSTDDYTEVSGNVAEAFTKGGKFRLTGPAYSNQQISISKNTTIDLNGNMLCNRSGGLDSFFLVEERATLTIEDLSKKQMMYQDRSIRPRRRRVSLRLWSGKKGPAPITALLQVLLTMRL